MLKLKSYKNDLNHDHEKNLKKYYRRTNFQKYRVTAHKGEKQNTRNGSTNVFRLEYNDTSHIVLNLIFLRIIFYKIMVTEAVLFM